MSPAHRDMASSLSAKSLFSIGARFEEMIVLHAGNFDAETRACSDFLY
jgi:hypothetical protein